jgi:N6-adenosine-specific RNA methylase IME4
MTLVKDPPAPLATMPIAEIRSGARHRKDMGDIAGLAASMAELGLLHPVVVRRDGTLIAGERRIRAATQLGWPDIPVTIVDLDDIARGEFAENAARKDFTLSEAVAIKRALEPIERAAAKQRQREGARRGGKACGNLPQASAGLAADKMAKATGMSRRTLEKAEAIIDAAEAEPDRFGKLLADMDRTGRVHGPYKRLKAIEQAAAIQAEPPPLPKGGPYRAGIVDIPWAYESDDETAPIRGILPYCTINIEQACAMPVASILHDDAVVGVWVTNFVLARGLHCRVLEAWGLEPKTIVTWPKDKIGRGYWVKGQTEHLVIATRGKPAVTLVNQTTLLEGPFHLVQKNTHSAKPVEAYDWFESLFPSPRYFDLFSRYRHAEKWDCHGDEAPSDSEAPYDAMQGIACARVGFGQIRERLAEVGGGRNPNSDDTSCGGPRHD